MSETLTSRERVLAAFAHLEPDREPCWCGASPEFLAKARRHLDLPDDEGFRVRIGDDFRRVFTRYTGPARPSNRTVFGVERAGHGYGQPLSHPLADATLQGIHDFILEETPVENVVAMFDAVAEFGRYVR